MNRKITIATVTLAFLASCSSNPRFPQNPKSGEVYRDNDGSSWVWDALMMRWILGGGNTYYYYPNENKYTNSTGIVTTPPRRSLFNKVNKSSTNTSKSRAVFGSIGRSRSVSA